MPRFRILWFGVAVASCMFLNHPADSFEARNKNPEGPNLENSKIVSATRDIFEIARETLSSEPENVGDFQAEAFIEKIFAIPCETTFLSTIERRILEAEAVRMSSDLGLSFDAGYSFREKDEDEDKHRAYAGISWNILDSGFWENRSRTRRILNDAEINRLQSEKRLIQESLLCRETTLKNYFCKMAIAFLEKKLHFLNLYYAIVEYAYFSGNVLLDDVLKVKYQIQSTIQDIQNIKLQLVDYEQPEWIETNFLPPAFDINIQALRNDILNDMTDEKILSLKEKNLKEKYSRLHHNQLRIYARLETDEEEGSYSYDNLGAGVRFSMPLGVRGAEKSLQLELLKVRKQREAREKKRLRVFRIKCNNFAGKLENTLESIYDRKVGLERLRRQFTRIKWSVGQPDILSLSRCLAELFDIYIEQAARLELLYREFNELLADSGLSFKSEYIVEPAVMEILKRERTGQRAVYIWSEFFNRIENSLLLDWFETKALTTAVVSFSKTIDKSKITSFLSLCKEQKIHVELMNSSNEWIFPDRFDLLAEYLSNAQQVADRIHLDIEPHGLADYHKNEDAYWNMYLSMLGYSKSLIRPGKLLCVSVPIWIDKQVIDRIYSLADQVYVMSYGIKEPSKLEKKLKPFFENDAEKTTTALRPADFESEYEFEMFLGTLSSRRAIEKFAIHDFKNYLRLVGK